MNPSRFNLLTDTRCKHCDTELVWVEKETVSASKDLLKPNFKTLGIVQTAAVKMVYNLGLFGGIAQLVRAQHS